MALFKQMSPIPIKIDPRFERLPLFKLIIVSLVVNFVVIGLGLLSKFILPPQIPIFFGLPQTNDQLASSFFIIIPPAVSLFFILVNSITAINIDGLYIKKSLAFASLAITLLSTIAVFKIIFLVGSL